MFNIAKEDGYFKKGNKMGGKRALPLALKGIKPLTKEELKVTFSKYLRMTGDEIAPIYENINSLSLLDAWMVSIITTSIRKGDASQLHYMLDRFWGRPKTDEEVPQSDNKPQIVITLPSNGKEAVEELNESESTFTS